MIRTTQSRVGAMISLLGGLLLSTTVLAQTGGPGGSVNGGVSDSPMLDRLAPGPAPALPNTTEPSTAPSGSPAAEENPAEEGLGTYGGMGTNRPCTVAGPNCPALNNAAATPNSAAPTTDTPPH